MEELFKLIFTLVSREQSKPIYLVANTGPDGKPFSLYAYISGAQLHIYPNGTWKVV